MTKRIALGFIGLMVIAASGADLTAPGTYSATGYKPGVSAPPGYYVSSQGATAPTPAPIGMFVSSAGKSYATQASAGTYAPTTGMANALPAPVGHFVSSLGASAATPAPAGSYVSTTGAATATPALQGTYVPCSAASAATQASAGHYVNTAGATEQTPAAPGFFVSSSGQSSAQEAPVGYYTPSAGMSAAIPAPAGSFVSSQGASSATLAPPGSFIDTPGVSLATSADYGTYVPTAGATSAIQAPPGSYVPTSGASAATLAPPGYFVITSGSTAAIASPPGRYVPTAGATATLQCPPGTTSYIASAACRIIQTDLPVAPYAVGPQFGSDVSNQVVETNTSGSFLYQITIENQSEDLGYDSPLTRLTIVDAFFSGYDAPYFDIEFETPFTLSEGESQPVKIRATTTIFNSIHAWLNLITDQNASVGEPGQTNRIHFVLLQSTKPLDGDGDGLRDTTEALLGTRDDLADTDGDGYEDGFESESPYMDPLVDDSDLVDFFQDERAIFNLYTATDVQEGSMNDLVLEPLGSGQYRFEWMLMSTTNLVEGFWDPVSTNHLLFTPDGALDTQLFRIRGGQ